jgi:tRNA pseudouridine55 synthase
MDGFIVVDKPAGMTSHDVVSAVRRLAGMKKVGHTGTLDPFATGVLPVALGEGTKAIPFLDESVKEYLAVMRLGESTDTQDCTGSIIRRGPWQGVTPDQVKQAAAHFLGKGSQVPPMFSALKRNGVPLYRLARKGEDVPREPRAIEVFSFVIDRIDLPEVVFTVSCSRGAYVRTLASDLGDRLGCGAHLVQLRRRVSGPFTLSQAVSLEKLAEVTGCNGLPDLLISCNEALSHLRNIPLTDRGAARVATGIVPEAGDMELPPGEAPGPGERVRFTRDGSILAVAELLADGLPESGGKPRLLRVFNRPER